MRKILAAFLILWGFSLQAQIHHKLKVDIDPGTSAIWVVDEITLPEGKEVDFFLNSDLQPNPRTKGLSVNKLSSNQQAHDMGMDHDDAGGANELKLTKWHLAWADRYPAAKTFTIEYAGVIHSALEQSAKNYQRGFSESPGIISKKGIYLAGSTYWVPIIGDEMMTFEMDVRLPRAWKSVSQGKRTQSKDGKDQWVCDKPQEEVFLIGAEFAEYSFDAGNVKAMAFLRTPDEGLANKYLETTAQYLDMYRQILGLYPYSKFALVENFWETGYGMPSFTLLGEKIIRFPFILHSSYPHELLHNWWGNSVYVDFDKGNWCEGLTAYMADHLIKEQRGKGEDYRRSTLQKYSDLVNAGNDFPLTEFKSRYDGPSEAIGYGKSLMMWHMLRRKFGDENFLKAMQIFYKKNRFKRASFDDIRQAFESVTNTNLKPFFDQWVTRKGAPKLTIETVKSQPLIEGGYMVTIRLSQKQSGQPFQLDVPISVVTERGTYNYVKQMKSRSQKFVFTFASEPRKVLVDPQFDLFRILDPKEVAPALTKAYGSDKTLIIMPKGAKLGSTYDAFAKSWIKDEPAKFELIYDDAIQELPSGKTVWILGFENRFAQAVRTGMQVYHADMTRDSIRFPNKNLAKRNHDIIITLPHPKDVKEAVVFVAIGDDAAIPGLVRKLPHYGKYSYLAFEGPEPTNIAKGQWPVISSPLVKELKINAPAAKLEKRKALAYLEPVFSSKDMMKDIRFMASPKMKGRGLGTPELDQVADYIASSFAQAGLQPAGEQNTYFQNWTADVKGKKAVKMKNVIAKIPGTNPQFKDEPVVISAHYDHLGKGWPDAHTGDEGKIHFGADDNASGVAVLLELARRMGKTAKPQRPIIFVAFTGEEAGLVGSRYFVKAAQEKFFANINLDTEGSLFDQKLIILNANTAKEWKFIFMGTDYVTGVPTQLVMKQLDSSDQGAFIEKGIPAVQFFSGATENYHRPSDTPDKIDAAGLVKVATVAKEVLVYLADRLEPMPFTGEKKEDRKAGQGTKDKVISWKASTGSVPSFSYEGKGVKIGMVPKGTPAEKAGLKKDDIIIELAGHPVEDLMAYTLELKKLKPGQTVSIKVLREGKELEKKITLKAR